MSKMYFIVNERGKEQLVIEDAKIRFHNYAGLQTDFNAAGNRNFDVILPDNEMAVAMGEKGWNVKIRKPRDPEDDPYYTLNVRINMNSRYKPTIMQHEGREELIYDELALGTFDPENPKYKRYHPDLGDPKKTLDDLDIDRIFIKINGSAWESQFGSGIKAYLDEFHFEERAPFYGNYYTKEEEEFDTERIPF